MCKGYTQKNTEYITPSFVIEFWKMINCTTCFAYKPNFLRKYIIYKQILKFVIGFTVFENHRKSLIQHCERSNLRLHFEGTKVNQKSQKWSISGSFWKPKACSQTELPDRPVFIGRILVENAKTEKFKCDIFGDFQALCGLWNSIWGKITKYKFWAS